MVLSVNYCSTFDDTLEYLNEIMNFFFTCYIYVMIIFERVKKRKEKVEGGYRRHGRLPAKVFIEQVKI